MPCNSAIVPAPNTQKDFYDWNERRQQKLEQARSGSHDLIFIGDSITHMFEMEGRGLPVWQRYFSRRNALDLGYGWDCTQNMLWRLEHGEFEGQRPKLVVLNAGSNNLAGNDACRANTPREAVEGIEAIVDWIQRQSPATIIAVMSLFPRGVRQDPIFAQVEELNVALKESLAGKPRIVQVDIGERFIGPDGEISTEFLDDRCHPTEKGYEIWAEAIEPLVNRYL